MNSLKSRVDDRVTIMTPSDVDGDYVYDDNLLPNGMVPIRAPLKTQFSTVCRVVCVTAIRLRTGGPYHVWVIVPIHRGSQ